MIAAVIPAAGAGVRFRTSAEQQSKQMLKLIDRPVYLWSVTALAKDYRVSAIVIPTSEHLIEQIKADLILHLDAEKRAKVSLITGGASRQESVFFGLQALAAGSIKPEHVLIHDAARPFLTAAMISDIIDGVTRYGACTLGLPVTDTLMVKDGDCLKSAVNRDHLVMTQTPQAGRFDWLMAGHEAAQSKQLSTTDDASILSAAGHEVHIVKGSRFNVKITDPEDFSLCEFLANTAFRNAL